MTTTAERIHLTDLKPAEPTGARRPLGVLGAVIAVGLAGWSVTLISGSRTAGDYVRISVVALWALCGLSLVLRRPREPMGMLLVGFAIAGAVWALGAAMLADSSAGSGMRDLGYVLRAAGIGFLPAVGMHILFGLPDGVMPKRSRRITVLIGYILSLGIAVLMWAQRPKLHYWPVVVAGALALLAGAITSTSKYNKSRGLERQRMQWFGWSMTVAFTVAVFAGATRLLVKWPTNAIEVAAIAALPIPLALAFGATTKRIGRVDRLLTQTVSVS